jgi:hypothetical protein
MMTANLSPALSIHGETVAQYYGIELLLASARLTLFFAPYHVLSDVRIFANHLKVNDEYSHFAVSTKRRESHVGEILPWMSETL